MPNNCVDRQPRPEVPGKPEDKRKGDESLERRAERAGRRKAATKQRRKRRRMAFRDHERHVSESERSGPERSGEESSSGNGVGDGEDTEYGEESGQSESSGSDRGEEDEDPLAQTADPQTHAASAQIVQVQPGESDEEAIRREIRKYRELRQSVRQNRWDEEKEKYVPNERRTDDIEIFGNDAMQDMDNEGRAVGPDHLPLLATEGLDDARLRNGRMAQLTFAATIKRR
jgi:hypothetical protein